MASLILSCFAMVRNNIPSIVLLHGDYGHRNQPNWA